MNISELKKDKIWDFFFQITEIPRPSRKEEKMILFLEKFAKDRNLELLKDEVNNILIRKKGNIPGKGIILQNHIDMVCEKTVESKHDFDNDPLDVYIEDGFVKANGTTLGADNGIGVSAALAVLDSDDIKHPDLECLFTIDEETGLNGALGLKSGVLLGDILLNLDSESEGEFVVGCAGGKNTIVERKLSYESLGNDDYQGIELIVGGLKGGHSGMDINSGLGNAIKVLGRCFKALEDKNIDFRIAKVNSGDKHNAIPRYAVAVLQVKKTLLDDFKNIIAKATQENLAEIEIKDPGLFSKIEEKENLSREVLKAKDQKDLINILFTMPHGVFAMSQSAKGKVETSTNLAACNTDKEKVVILTSQRSSFGSAVDNLSQIVQIVGEMGGGNAIFADGYPSWQPNFNSDIKSKAVEVYKDTFEKEPTVDVIHAGLECGLIGAKYPDLDMISFGPNIYSPHSPDERVEINSVGRFYKLLVNMLQKQ